MNASSLATLKVIYTHVFEKYAEIDSLSELVPCRASNFLASCVKQTNLQHNQFYASGRRPGARELDH